MYVFPGSIKNVSLFLVVVGVDRVKAILNNVSSPVFLATNWLLG
jgi:hypothetical protein